MLRRTHPSHRAGVCRTPAHAVPRIALRARGAAARGGQRRCSGAARVGLRQHPLARAEDGTMTAPSALTARLGLGDDARAIILNADDFGMCRAANEAITDLLHKGHLDSATVMVPCGWAPHALAFAAAHPTLSVGVHLVLTSEWTRYRWRPLTGTGTSLVDEVGFFPA